MADEWRKWQIEMSGKISKKDEEGWSVEKNVRFVGGADVSTDGIKTVVGICVFSFPELKLLKEIVKEFPASEIPYIPGYLGMREAPAVLAVLDQLKEEEEEWLKDTGFTSEFVLLVDGNGVLHERRFGSACHIGLLGDVITIGVAKTFYCVPGVNLSRHEANQIFKRTEEEGETVKLLADELEAAAVRTSLNASTPVFVSVGNRISLESAVEIVKKTSKYRVPEPIRRADFISRAFLKQI